MASRIIVSCFCIKGVITNHIYQALGRKLRVSIRIRRNHWQVASSNLHVRLRQNRHSSIHNITGPAAIFEPTP